MSNVNYVFAYDMERLAKLKQELTDLLFDKGYRISKPLIDDLAFYTYHKEDRAVFQVTTKQTSATAPTNDTESMGGENGN